MKLLKQGDGGVAKIINRKQLNNEAEFRISLFTFFYCEKDRYLLKNTLSKEITELTEQEWKAVGQIKNGPVGYRFIMDNGLERLALTRYIVEKEYDEVKQYQQTIFLLKTMSGRKKGLNFYTIFPTTGCNARCVYCYEEGYAVKNMTIKTADRLIDFICETRHDDKITIRWFGGEPLAGANIIRHICNGLQKRNVPFISTMVTNASLMTKELAHEAKELWHLERVQISLDGAKEDYTQRKNYYNPEKHNYDAVMKAIHYIADEGVKVNLRVNVDLENIARIPDFLKDIKNEFSNMKNVYLYFNPLYQELKSENCIELYKEIFILSDILKSMGLSETVRSLQDFSHIRLDCCMADRPEKDIVITPDGMFNNCEHLPEGHSWGNIFDGVTDKAKFDELSSAPKVDEKCAKCPFLPECTPFYKNGCPGWFEKCYEYNCMRTERSLHSFLSGENTETENDDEEA
ncbi:MAG: radical SAM protein [Ruminococcus sp.]|uniref:radical SAM protein n=1 Tax=Ruminococcus sp. TaxID=41978 RepID=UPI0025D69A76|nr:radical SAM protein [Ruminococcus sp.]MCR4794284.1 radical SAM protein [Ruminococcus sp.]